MEVRDRVHRAKLSIGDALRFHETPARITLRGARASYVGPGLRLAAHRNAVATIAIAIGEPFDLLWTGPEAGRSLPGTHRIALIPPGAHHHVTARGPMAFLYLDALSDDHAALQGGELKAAQVRLHGALGGAPESWTMDALCNALRLPTRRAPDPRIAALVRDLDERPEDFRSLAEAAEITGLSTSRLRALTRAALGLPLQRYRLWRRMARAMRELAAGESLTTSAYAAGFASSAHLSSSFRAMFGLAPSNLLKAGAVFDLTSDRPVTERRVAPPRALG
jgi:AraC-like DNA-binding protein